MAEVDMPYLEEIVSQIKIQDVFWKVSYYGQEEHSHHEAVLQDLGVPISHAFLHEMAHFVQ